MLSCQQATRLISAAQERSLNRREKFALKFHTLLCRGCNNFGKNVATIRKAMRGFAGGRDEANAE